MNIKEKFPGVFLADGKLATLAQNKDYRPFGEQIISGYRLWDPNRSKLGAAIMKGIRAVPINRGDKILYLGIAHGFTASFVSDIVGPNGIIYGIEFSDRCFRELLPIAEKFKNIVPMLADARMPEKYGIFEKVDAVFCDIADPQQTEVAIRNCKAFLKPEGFLMLAIKTQSIDVTAQPREVMEGELKKLEKEKFEIIDWKNLEPFEEKHFFVVARFRG